MLATGAVRTPQLLMLSGIGPAEHLREHGTEVVHDAPGVGEGLQDHPAVLLPRPLRNAPRMRDTLYDDPERVCAVLRRGPLSTLGQGVAALHVAGADAGDSSAPTAPVRGPPRGGRRPAAAGGPCAVLLHRAGRPPQPRSGPPRVRRPRRHPRYLTDPSDRVRLRTAVRRAFELFDAPALQEVTGPDPTSLASDDAALDAFIDQTLTTYQHPVGSARMGADPSAVVDPALAVHGIGGPHVVDASVMPSITRGKPQATVIAIAERAADLLRGVSSSGGRTGPGGPPRQEGPK